MNVDVLLLFVNATLSMVLAAVIVFVILRREYLPVIRKLEAERRQERPAPDDTVNHAVNHAVNDTAKHAETGSRRQ